MTERIIIAGAGGQGIMLLGKILAQAAMRQDKFVTWLPSYGAEVRGGTSHCMVIISDTEIGSPYIEKADTLIIMNQPSLEKFKAKLKNKGLLIVNSSLTGRVDYQNMQISQFPFTDIAIKLGNIKIANMVALGCFVREKKTVHLESIFEAIVDIAPKEKKGLIEINKKALEEGVRLK
ncbi:MAG: 2-oxoacid:acceptor oxidoreductase family protein [Candidatus Omnitrophica bacterium]|nr:2-oxoacid:acceptor oxidoreductase family protein [Candidatus Omnitrophota bacterium]